MKKNFQFSIFNFQFKSSFTFVEALVVVGVIGLTLPALFAIIFVVLRQQVKIYRLAEVKRQGDYIVTAMEDRIKNRAYTIFDASNLPLCPTPPIGSPFSNVPVPTGSYFLDQYNSQFSFDWNGIGTLSQSVSNQPAPAPTIPFPQGPLNTAKVKMTSFNVTCSRSSAYSAPVVNVFFHIDYNTTSTRPEDTASLDYQTSIKLRNFPSQ